MGRGKGLITRKKKQNLEVEVTKNNTNLYVIKMVEVDFFIIIIDEGSEDEVPYSTRFSEGSVA